MRPEFVVGRFKPFSWLCLSQFCHPPCVTIVAWFAALLERGRPFIVPAAKITTVESVDTTPTNRLDDHASVAVRKKSPTSACRLSMSSTTKTPEHIVSAYNLPRGHAATEAPEFTEAA